MILVGFLWTLKEFNFCPRKNWGNHAVQFSSGSLWPPKRLLFFLRVWMPRLLGDFRGIPAGLSLRLFVLGTRSVWVLFLFLSPRALSADGDPHPRWPTHQNKGDRGSWFSDKHHSLSLLSEGQGAWRFISRGSPPLSPSTGPPPHPTGAAKSKCQSRRRRCIPSRGQLVVATEGSVASLRRRLFQNLPVHSSGNSSSLFYDDTSVTLQSMFWR